MKQVTHCYKLAGFLSGGGLTTLHWFLLLMMALDSTLLLTCKQISRIVSQEVTACIKVGAIGISYELSTIKGETTFKQDHATCEVKGFALFHLLGSLAMLTK